MRETRNDYLGIFLMVHCVPSGGNCFCEGKILMFIYMYFSLAFFYSLPIDLDFKSSLVLLDNKFRFVLFTFSVTHDCIFLPLFLHILQHSAAFVPAADTDHIIPEMSFFV